MKSGNVSTPTAPWRPSRYACIAVVLLALVPIRAEPASAASPESRFQSLINSERAARDLRLLSSAADLASVAERHSAEMARKGRIWHTPDLPSKVRNWRVLGENVGVGPTVERLHAAFMRSSAHRENVLYRAYDHVGIGAVIGNDEMIYVTVIFVQRNPVATPARTGAVRPSRSRALPAVAAAPRPPTSTVRSLLTIQSIAPRPAHSKSSPIDRATRLAARGRLGSVRSVQFVVPALLLAGALIAGRQWMRRMAHRFRGADARMIEWVGWAERTRLPATLSLRSPRSLYARLVPVRTGLSAAHVLNTAATLRRSLVADSPQNPKRTRSVRLPDSQHEPVARARSGARVASPIDTVLPATIVLPTDDRDKSESANRLTLEWAGMLFCVVSRPGSPESAYYHDGTAWVTCSLDIAHLQSRGARRVPASEIKARGLALPEM